MGLFSRKPQPVQPTGFQQFLQNDKKYFWVAQYLDERNEIDEEKVFLDMPQDEGELSKFTMPKFKTIVANLYADYLKVEKKVTNEDLWLLNQIERMPLNITVRRIKAKASGNNWSVQYLGRTVYYGKTLNEAIRKLQDRNPKVAAKFQGPQA